MTCRLFETVDRANVGMIQRGEHLRFTLEARDAIGIARERFRQDLDRDFAIQPRSVARYTSPIPPAPMRATIS